MKRAVLTLLCSLSLLALFVVGVDWLFETSGVLNEVLFGRATAWQGVRATGTETLQFGIAAALFLLPVLTAAAWLLCGRDDHITARANDGDLIRLAPAAIERVVNREVRARVAEVIKVGATARQGNRQAAAVTVHVAVSDRYPVPEVRTHVRTETMRVLKQLLGVADAEQVRVVVHDIKGAGGRAAAPRRSSSKAKGAAKSLPAKKAAAPAKGDASK